MEGTQYGTEFKYTEYCNAIVKELYYFILLTNANRRTDDKEIKKTTIIK